jgi:hypothetical protein
MKRKIFLVFVFILVLIQFIRPKLNNKEDYDLAYFIEETNLNKHLLVIMKNSCFDCHSNKTNYPWYSHISPVSMWIQNHIDEGKKHLNFSKWDKYSLKKKENKLEELIEEIQEGEMSLKSYKLIHTPSRLDNKQKDSILNSAMTTKIIYQDLLSENKNKH